MVLLLSTRTHAKIKSVDPSAALKAKGVLGYVDYRDIKTGANFDKVRCDFYHLVNLSNFDR